MVELARSDEDTLVLVFATDRPIGAADIGILLRELSSDYKRVTGGKLVLWRYETGSSWIYLRDAIAIAGSVAGSMNEVSIAVQHMMKFVTYMRNHFDKASNESPDTRMDLVTKSATRIAKIAAENGADVQMTYNRNEKAGAESFTLNVNHQRATKLHSAAKRRNVVAAKADVPKVQVDVTNSGLEQMTRRLIAGGGSSELVEAIVLALKASGGDYLLPALAVSLESAGRPDIAQIVRRHIKGTGKTMLQLPRE